MEKTRKPPKTDTERAEAAKNAERHLADLRKAYQTKLLSLCIPSASVVSRMSPPRETSEYPSPAAACAEF